MNEPVVKLWVRLEASSPPVPALALPAEIIPSGPPGIFSVTWVFWKYPLAGVKTAVSPSTCQLPAICGESVGMGVPAPSGAENCTRIGAAPLTPFAPAAGVTDSTWSGAGRSCWVTAAAWAAETGAAWLPGGAKVTIATPATKTIAAPLAVRAAPRRFHRGRLGCAVRDHHLRRSAPRAPRR